jgi:hypothetical protein
MGDLTIQKGTAIATFVNGKYPNNSHDNHAAFYISQDAGGIWVVDQWKSQKRQRPQGDISDHKANGRMTAISTLAIMLMPSQSLINGV